MLWGRDPWLPELFNASVEMKSISPGTLELTNKSSLPITVSSGGVAINLHQNQKQQLYRAERCKKLTVLNWMIGMDKPLEVPLSMG